MGKAKAKKPVSIPHKHVYSRISYLYQAATYLSNTTELSPRTFSTAVDSNVEDNDSTSKDESARPQRSQTKFLLNQIRGMTRKAQLRLHSEIKRTICKRCDALLIPGRTSTVTVENASRDGHKKWADVLVLKCNDCQSIKRFPIGQTRKTKGGAPGVQLDIQDCNQPD